MTKKEVRVAPSFLGLAGGESEARGQGGKLREIAVELAGTLNASEPRRLSGLGESQVRASPGKESHVE